MSDPSPTIPPFIPTGPTDEGLPGQIVWDRECIYTFDGAHWGRTPRAVSSGAWDDLYTPEGGPSARFLLASKPQSLTDREKEQAQLNIGLLPATTESFGIVRYTDSWMDNGSGDPGDYPVTLTRHAIMELIGNKLVAGTSNVTVTYDVTTGNTSISVSGGGGGGGEPFDGHLNADLVIGHGIVGTKAEWSVPLGDPRHEGRIDEASTGYSVFIGVDPDHTVDDLLYAINVESPLKFIVQAVKVSDSEIKLVALEQGTAPNVYVFTASASPGTEDPCFGTGVLVRTVNGSISVPASTYTATLNGKPMLSAADIARRVTAYGQNPVSSEGVFRALYDKQDKLEWDAVPTANSTKPVYSGGVYTALQGKQNTLTWDTSPKSGSNNPVYSKGIYTALQGKQATLTFDLTPVPGSHNPVYSAGVYSAFRNLEMQPAQAPEPLVGLNAKASTPLSFLPFYGPELYIELRDGSPIVACAWMNHTLTADNVHEFVSFLNSGDQDSLRGYARASWDGGMLTIEAIGSYKGSAGDELVLKSGAATPYEVDVAFSGGDDSYVPVLKHLHRYAATVPSAGLDLSGVTVDTYASAEVWLDCTPSPGLVDWPSDWSWVDGKVPPQSFTQNTRLFIDVVNDGRTVVANFKHYYTYA